LLALRGLRKRYPESAAPAVDGLSLEVRRGEVFGLLGPNGAGKTTTVAMATGLLSPDEGEVALEGLGAPVEAAVRAHIGVAPQALALYDDLSGEENLALFARLYGVGAASLEARVAAALDFVGLRDRGRDRVKSYSGGMKRRLNLAVAVVHEPTLVVLDEPTVGVDPQSRNLIFENIRALKAQGRTVLYTTHYMEEAERLCDRVGILDQGRLLALDTVEGLLRAHAHEPVVRVEPPGLEQVFLHLTGRQLRD
jgi:ABC-2 type transport system ATP-binding protein